MNNIAILETKSPRTEFIPIRERKIRSKYRNVLDLLGWSQVPTPLLKLIERQLFEWKNELDYGYASVTNEHFADRSRSRYWVNAYLNNYCSLATALQALKD